MNPGMHIVFPATHRRRGVIESVLDQLRDLIDYECAKLFDDIGSLRGTPNLGIGEGLRKSAKDVGGNVARVLLNHVVKKPPDVPRTLRRARTMAHHIAG